MYSLKKYIPFYKRNLKVALPVMITQAGQVVVQLADNIMVGHVGTAELAGVSFANAIFLIGFITLIGFSQGLTPLVGESFAKGEHKKASHLLRHSLMLNLWDARHATQRVTRCMSSSMDGVRPHGFGSSCVTPLSLWADSPILRQR